MVQCIFGHVGSISRDFVDSNRALSNLVGKWFGFSHTLDPKQAFGPWQDSPSLQGLPTCRFAGCCYEISVSMKARNSGFRRLLIALQHSRAPGGATIALMLSRIPDQCSVLSS
jgi:hypothetical protein